VPLYWLTEFATLLPCFCWFFCLCLDLHLQLNSATLPLATPLLAKITSHTDKTVNRSCKQSSKMENCTLWPFIVTKLSEIDLSSKGSKHYDIRLGQEHLYRSYVGFPKCQMLRKSYLSSTNLSSSIRCHYKTRLAVLAAPMYLQNLI